MICSIIGILLLYFLCPTLTNVKLLPFFPRSLGTDQFVNHWPTYLPQAWKKEFTSSQTTKLPSVRVLINSKWSEGRCTWHIHSVCPLRTIIFKVRNSPIFLPLPLLLSSFFPLLGYELAHHSGGKTPAEECFLSRHRTTALHFFLPLSLFCALQ